MYKKEAKLLVDNHEAYGFHIHKYLPEKPSYLEVIEADSYEKALDVFWKEVWEILANEQI